MCSRPRTSSTTGGPTSSASCCCDCATPTSPISALAAWRRPWSWPTSRRWSRSGRASTPSSTIRAIAESLKPYYRQFCKRPCFHDEYLDVFNLPNVTLVDTDGRGVDRITERGVVVGETEFELDCIIYATGFEVGTDYTRRSGLRRGRAGRTDVERQVARRRGHVPRPAQSGVPQPVHLQPPPVGVHRELPARPGRAEQAHRVHPAPRVRSRASTPSRRRRRPRTPGWRRSSSRRSSTSPSSSRARPATTTTRASRATRAIQNGFYGGGSVAFFKVLADWRASGDLPGSN